MLVRRLKNRVEVACFRPPSCLIFGQVSALPDPRGGEILQSQPLWVMA
jgi:hypothetical protein